MRKMGVWWGKSLAAAATLAAGVFTGSAQAVPVALELSLVIDVSGSVSSSEYDLQRQGYRNAFLDPTVQANIASFFGAGGIAINVIQFSDNATQAIGWTLLDSVGDINAFASAIGSMTRLFSGGTDVQDGMLAGIASFSGNGYEGARLVMDVSGDGHQNTDPACAVFGPTYDQACASVRAARDAAAAAGIVVNGLAIEDGTYGVTGLTNWYDSNVRTAGGFVSTASFTTFEAAVTDKIGREIIGQVPEPATVLLAAHGRPSHLGRGRLSRPFSARTVNGESSGVSTMPPSIGTAMSLISLLPPPLANTTGGKPTSSVNTVDRLGPHAHHRAVADRVVDDCGRDLEAAGHAFRGRVLRRHHRHHAERGGDAGLRDEAQTASHREVVTHHAKDRRFAAPPPATLRCGYLPNTSTSGSSTVACRTCALSNAAKPNV
jgi:hypothetical protein